MAAGQDDVFARSGHGGFMCGVDMEAVPCAQLRMQTWSGTCAFGLFIWSHASCFKTGILMEPPADTGTGDMLSSPVRSPLELRSSPRTRESTTSLCYRDTACISSLPNLRYYGMYRIPLRNSHSKSTQELQRNRDPQGDDSSLVAFPPQILILRGFILSVATIHVLFVIDRWHFPVDNPRRL